MTELSVIGKRGIRVDATEKVTGDAKYVSDLSLPRMLHGKILRSPHPHARILNIDTAKSERLPGVKAVVTSRDAPQKSVPGAIADQYVLAKDKVRFIGDDVAAVAAIDEDTAEYALELIEIDYEVLPAVFDPIEAMKKGAPQIHEAVNNIARHFETSRGDTEQGFKEAEHIFEDTYMTQMVQHSPLETISCIASYDSSGKFTFWAGSQDPYASRLIVADYFGIPVSNIRVIQPYIGGGFGGKIGPLIMPICGILSRKAGYPVKIVKTRQEDITTSFSRVPVSVYLKTGVSRDGLLTAKEMRIILDNGAYSLLAPHILTCMVVSRPDSLYRYQNVKNQGYLVYTNKIPSNAFRGFGNPQIAFGVESQLDVIAEKLGIDPVELRLKNATQQGDITAHGWQIRSCGLNDCINNSAKQINWTAKKSEEKTRRGIGIACTCHPSGNRAGFNFAGSSALIRVDEDGRVNVSSGEIDIGQGSQTIFAHIAAEVLGVPLKDVTVSQFDSDTSPYAIGTKASRVTHLGGKAVQVAAMDAKRQLLKIAGKKLEVKVDDLEIMNARVFVKSSPEKAMTIPETVKSGLYSRGGALIVGKGVFDPNTVMADTTGYGDMSSAYEFGAHTAEVEVDIDTGRINVLNYVATHDSGRTLNTTIAKGQVQGGVTQGIGFVLTEELVHKDGKIINDTFTDYKILTALDVPPIESVFVESNDPNGPFGAKGLGEPVIIPVAPAIANAIYDAVGVRIKELPITPEKILKALRKKEG